MVSNVKILALQKLVEAAEMCKDDITKEKSHVKRELLSRAYAELSDIIEKMIEEDLADGKNQ